MPRSRRRAIRCDMSARFARFEARPRGSASEELLPCGARCRVRCAGPQGGLASLNATASRERSALPPRDGTFNARLGKWASATAPERTAGCGARSINRVPVRRERAPSPRRGGPEGAARAERRAARSDETEATREESKARGARAPPEALGLPTRRARRAACCVRRVCSLVVRAPPARGGGPAGVARAE